MIDKLGFSKINRQIILERRIEFLENELARLKKELAKIKQNGE